MGYVQFMLFKFSTSHNLILRPLISTKESILTLSIGLLSPEIQIVMGDLNYLHKICYVLFQKAAVG